MSEQEETALPAAKRLLGGQRTGVLASSDHGHPHTTMIVFAATNDCRTFVFFIDRRGHTYRNLKADGRVCLMVDTRGDGAGDLWSVEALRVKGVAWELKNGHEFDKLREHYLDIHPDLTDFANGSEVALFKVTIDNAQYVSRFYDVTDVEF